MSFAYDKTLPNPPHTPAQDVGTMQTNSNSIYNLWGVDHYTFDAAAPGSPGQHAQCTFPTSISPPLAPTNPISYLFTYDDAATGKVQLKYLNPLNSGQYTSSQTGSTTLFGGIIIKWGFDSISSGNSKSVNFAGNFPTACFVGFACPDINAVPGTDQFLSVGSLSTSSMNVWSKSSSPVSFFYIAIGN